MSMPVRGQFTNPIGGIFVEILTTDLEVVEVEFILIQTILEAIFKI